MRVKSRSGNTVTVGVIRDKKEQNLNLTLPDRKESGDLLEEESSDESLIDADSRVELGELRHGDREAAAADGTGGRRLPQSPRQNFASRLANQQKQMREEGVKQRDGQFRKQERELRLKLDQMRRNYLHVPRPWLDI